MSAKSATERQPKPAARKRRAPSSNAVKRPAGLAHGRWLGDFVPLSPAEKVLVACCTRGEIWRPKNWNGKRPEKPNRDNLIRAPLIRFLALGGDQDNPIHELGVTAQGAWFADTLNLHQCRLPARLDLKFCHFAVEPIFAAASLPELALSGSFVRGLQGDRLHVSGGLFLQNQFLSEGTVRLLGAHIGGNFSCNGGTFTGTPQPALGADGIVVAGAVYLNRGFAAEGSVRLLGAEIGGELDCSEGTFIGRGDTALIADAATIKGGLFLRHATFEGGLSLLTVRVGTLLDDEKCWASGEHMLDGLSYDRIIGPTDAKKRVAWLLSQQASELGIEPDSDFAPQPWEQLAAVLRAMGHPHEARRIAIEKQRAMRRAGIYGLPHSSRGFTQPLTFSNLPAALKERVARSLDELRHRAFGLLSGYGYRPWRILGWVVGLVIAFAGFFWVFGVGCSHFTGCAGNQPAAFYYSLDALLPVDFGLVKGSLPSESLSTPDSTRLPVRALSVIETLLGWVLGVVVLAIVGNLVRKD